MTLAWSRNIALTILIALFGVSPALAADTAPPDAAATTISTLHGALIDTMKHGKELGFAGRSQKLAPTIDAAFDIPVMAQFTVGPTWASMAQPDRDAVIAAFRHYMISDYAHNFASFSGEHFTYDPNVITHGEDRIVQTKLIPRTGDPVPLNYRMRQTPQGWKIVDVFLDGFASELSTRRSDFASTVAAGGGPALAKKLNALSDGLSK